MGKIVPRTAKDVVKILERFGFKFVSRGRHDKYRNEERGISVPVPVSHGVISRGAISEDSCSIINVLFSLESSRTISAASLIFSIASSNVRPCEATSS